MNNTFFYDFNYLRAWLATDGQENLTLELAKTTFETLDYRITITTCFLHLLDKMKWKTSHENTRELVAAQLHSRRAVKVAQIRVQAKSQSQAHQTLSQIHLMLPPLPFKSSRGCFVVSKVNAEGGFALLEPAITSTLVDHIPTPRSALGSYHHV